MEIYKITITLICGIAVLVFAKGMYSESKKSMKELNEHFFRKEMTTEKFEKQEVE